jgi:ribonuclease Z
MKITFLGTSSGKVSLTRFHSSILLSVKNYNLLIDAGDGISRALLNSNIGFDSVNGILITHLHPDHFSGLPLLMVQMKMMKRTEPLDIFANESLMGVIKNFLLTSYLLPERMTFEIRYKKFKDESEFFISDSLSFISKKNKHLEDVEEYQSKYPDIKFYSGSFLFQSTGKEIIYTSDIGSEKDLLLFESIRSDLLISEATHISVDALIKNLEKFNSPSAYITHYSDEQISGLSEILANLPETLKGKVHLAKDGVSFEI